MMESMLQQPRSLAIQLSLMLSMLTAALGYDGAVVAATEKYGALAAAEAAYRAEVYKGEMLQDERAAWRRKIASRATMRRYLDMYNRVERNAALAKYSTGQPSISTVPGMS